MEIKFSTKNEKQLLAAEYWIDDITEQLLYGGAKYGGKSFLGASLIFGDALIYPETNYFIARKERVDLVSYTIPTINEVFGKWRLNIGEYAVYNGQLNCFTLYNKSKVLLLACKEEPSDPMYERFGSMQMTRGWIEEGGEVSEAAKANLWLSIGRWKNDVYNLKKKLLITANPKKGWMKREFIDPWRQGTLPKNKQFIQAFATDNKYASADYLETLKNEKDPVRNQRLWKGNWDYDENNDLLVSYDALSDAFSNTIVKDGEKYLAIDVARNGKDTTTFNYWDGLELYKIEVFTKQDTQRTIQLAKDRAAAEKIPYSRIIIDEDGIGGAVVDGMWGVKSFVANSSPLPTKTEIRTKQSKLENEFVPKINFANLKSQCAWKAAELINEHKLAFRVPEYREKIIEELTALLRQNEVDNDKKLQLKPKPEVKEELGRSPDIGDPIIYRMWFELQKDASTEDPEKEKVISLQRVQFINKRARFKQNSNR
jgi:phage terminase large subunit